MTNNSKIASVKKYPRPIPPELQKQHVVGRVDTLQGVRQKAGLLPTQDLDRLVPLSLIEVHRKERLDYLRQFVEQICTEVPGHKFLLLDVITDCLSDFNAASETLELFDYLNRLINDFQLTILLVIHENPGTEKARGHTGTEAQNKASTILQIGFERGPKGEETELIKLRVLKLRAGKRPEPLFLQYCLERRGLALAGEDQLEEVLRSRRLKADVDDVAFDLGKFLEGEKEQKELLEFLKEKYGASPNTLKERLRELEERKITIYDSGGTTCWLVAETSKGSATRYSLEPLDG